MTWGRKGLPGVGRPWIDGFSVCWSCLAWFMVENEEFDENKWFLLLCPLVLCPFSILTTLFITVIYIYICLRFIG